MRCRLYRAAPWQETYLALTHFRKRETKMYWLLRHKSNLSTSNKLVTKFSSNCRLCLPKPSLKVHKLVPQADLKPEFCCAGCHNPWGHNLHCCICDVCLLQKNRKMIPCYWENQPGGCRKPHCSFQHKNPRVPPAVTDMEKAKEC
jgi:hypothetical protein